MWSVSSGELRCDQLQDDSSPCKQARTIHGNTRPRKTKGNLPVGDSHSTQGNCSEIKTKSKLSRFVWRVLWNWTCMLTLSYLTNVLSDIIPGFNNMNVLMHLDMWRLSPMWFELLRAQWCPHYLTHSKNNALRFHYHHNSLSKFQMTRWWWYHQQHHSDHHHGG